MNEFGIDSCFVYSPLENGNGCSYVIYEINFLYIFSLSRKGRVSFRGGKNI